MTDVLFHIIDDAAVVLRSKGVFQQAKLYRRAGAIYAGWGKGFIRLQAGSGTTLPGVSWDEIAGDGIQWRDRTRAPVWNG
jgi:hypothetical protein